MTAGACSEVSHFGLFELRRVEKGSTLAHQASVSVMPGVWSAAEVMAQQISPVVGMDDTGTIVLWKHGTRRALV